MRSRLVFSDELTEYDFGPDHPMAPGRVKNTVSLARQLGVLDRLEVVPPPPVDLELLRTVHRQDYIDAVERGVPDERYGLGNSDNPVFPNMHEVSAEVVMATVEAARQVWTGEADRASNIAGGCTTPCRTGRAASASTTTSPWRSAGCWTTAASGSRTSTSTSTTATACSRSSGTTRGC